MQGTLSNPTYIVVVRCLFDTQGDLITGILLFSLLSLFALHWNAKFMFLVADSDLPAPSNLFLKYF